MALNRSAITGRFIKQPRNNPNRGHDPEHAATLAKMHKLEAEYDALGQRLITMAPVPVGKGGGTFSPKHAQLKQKKAGIRARMEALHHQIARLQEKVTEHIRSKPIWPPRSYL